MKIDCIADLHGHYPTLAGGDLLIVAGDLTARDSGRELMDFVGWLMNQKYKKIIVIAGNHDKSLTWNKEHVVFDEDNRSHIQYLCDSGTEFEGLKIWGSPWTQTFPGINPHCTAFTLSGERELAEKWALIPDDTDILVTHSPSFGNLDANKDLFSCGSVTLWLLLLSIRPKLHVYGHIHEGYGHVTHANGIQMVNASHVNEKYQPVNKPITIHL